MTVIEQERPRPIIDDWLASLNIENGLYLLTGLVALGLRLFRLGDWPLTEVEAREALSAWRFVSMSPIAPVVPVSALWYSLTSLTFLLLGANEFWARFWPALAGTALVFTPILFRRDLGRGAAVVSSILLAISPVVLAASRAADGTTLAALCLVAVAAGLRRTVREPSRTNLIVTGLALGLGLTSGPRFISGLVATFIGVVFVIFVRPEVARHLRTSWNSVAGQLWPALAAAAVTVLLVASTALLNPTGLTAAGSAIPLWFRGWLGSETTAVPYLVPQVLFAYEPLLLVMGVGGLYVAFFSGAWHTLAERFQLIFAAPESDPDLQPAYGGGGASELDWRGTASVLSAAAIGALIFGILYTGRQASDALWVIVPLSLLAGKVIVETFGGDWFEGELETVLAQAGVLVVMLAFTYFQLSAYGRGYTLTPVCADFLLNFFTPETCGVGIRLLLAGAVTGLAIFVTVMFALGWSRLSAVRGATLALGVATLVGTISSGLALGLFRADDPNSLWSPRPTVFGLRMMMDEVSQISLQTVGKEEDLEVAIVSNIGEADRDGLLGWELRKFSKARFVATADLALGAPVIIATSGFADPVLATDYLGERFPVQARQLLQEPSFQTVVSWWLFRIWPTDYTRSLDLWVRPDVHNLITQR